jgi:hypothetical protein
MSAANKGGETWIGEGGGDGRYKQKNSELLKIHTTKMLREFLRLGEYAYFINKKKRLGLIIFGRTKVSVGQRLHT